MNRLFKLIMLPAFALALAGAPVVANACMTCVIVTSCNDDGANCNTTMTCTISKGACPTLA